MITKRSSEDRGPTDIGWLKSMHSFSFGGYHDPKHMGFSELRVINEDRVAPAAGFETHPHKNMEIISYVLSGELAHKDSMGNGSSIKPGDIQIMSAGSGVTHSEFNVSNANEVHFLQIWVTPNVQNQEPSYQQKSINFDDINNQFVTVISPDQADEALHIKQDAKMMIGQFSADIEHALDPKLNYWAQIAQGSGTINGHAAEAGDGFALSEENKIKVRPENDLEILLFELP